MLRNLVLVSLVALLSTPAAHALTPPFPGLPPDAQIIEYGSTCTVSGRMEVRVLEGKTVFLTKFARPLFEKVAVRMPMGGPANRPFPRVPPFSYRKIEALTLAGLPGTDLAAAAKLLGARALVDCTGTYGFNARNMTQSLKLTKLTLRGHELPSPLPTPARLVTLAKKAVRDFFMGSADSHFFAMTAEYIGALQVQVIVKSNGHSPAPSTSILSYDGLTGELTFVGASDAR